MPKNFVFYNPEHHKEIIALLEQGKPAGIVTVTRSQPDQVGALDPFPLIVDGDFDVPNVYCSATVGQELAGLSGEDFRLNIDARRIPSTATNVIARLNPGGSDKIVITAHIDAYEDSPGALDNASGTVVLLLLAEMLADYRGDHHIEIAALNGEDHYSAGGEMDYLDRYGAELPKIRLVINIDDLGYPEGKSCYSLYECSPQLEKRAKEVFGAFPGLAPGEQWFMGDHMVFVQKGIPSVAFASEHMAEVMKTVAHTPRDTPDMVDCRRLVEVAEALNALVRKGLH